MLNEFDRAEKRGDFDSKEGPRDSESIGIVEEAKNASILEGEEQNLNQKDLTVVFEDTFEEVKQDRSESIASVEEMSTYFEGINNDFDSQLGRSQSEVGSSRKSEQIAIGRSQRDFK